MLKLDCEGTKYELLVDERFRPLKAGTMVLEWHATGRHPEAQREIFTPLESLGFEVASVNRYELRQRLFGLSAVGVA